MRQTGILILAILILLGTFKEAAIFVSFKIQQDYIAKNLCVEKDIEGSTCKGCCQLNKKIEETRTEDKQQAPERQREQTQPLVFFTNALFKQNFKSALNRLMYKTIFQAHYNFQFYFDIFRPPKV